MESILEIPFSEDKQKNLQKISIKLDTLRILVRLSKDSGSITTKKYFQTELALAEIGKMLGGWIRVYNQRANG